MRNILITKFVFFVFFILLMNSVFSVTSNDEDDGPLSVKSSLKYSSSSDDEEENEFRVVLSENPFRFITVFSSDCPPNFVYSGTPTYDWRGLGRDKDTTPLVLNHSKFKNFANSAAWNAIHLAHAFQAQFIKDLAENDSLSWDHPVHARVGKERPLNFYIQTGDPEEKGACYQNDGCFFLPYLVTIGKDPKVKRHAAFDGVTVYTFMALELLERMRPATEKEEPKGDAVQIRHSIAHFLAFIAFLEEKVMEEDMINHFHGLLPQQRQDLMTYISKDLSTRSGLAKDWFYEMWLKQAESIIGYSFSSKMTRVRVRATSHNNLNGIWSRIIKTAQTLRKELISAFVVVKKLNWTDFSYTFASSMKSLSSSLSVPLPSIDEQVMNRTIHSLYDAKKSKRKSRYMMAISTFEEALNESVCGHRVLRGVLPVFVQIWIGESHAKEGEHEKAVDRISQALQAKDAMGAYFIFSKFRATVYISLAQSYSKLKRWADSISAYEAALRIKTKQGETVLPDEESGKAFSELARTFIQEGNDRKAVESFRESLNQRKNWEVFVDTIKTCFRLKDFESAQQVIADFQNVYLNQSVPIRFEGVWFHLQGKYEDATKKYIEALRLADAENGKHIQVLLERAIKKEPLREEDMK